MSHKLVSLYIGDGEYYTRTDADLVIAEKDAKIADLIKKNKRLAHKDLIMASETIKEVFKELCHNKYKRCLAMAQVLDHVCPITNRKSTWRDKWHKRWLELAEKFKELK